MLPREELLKGIENRECVARAIDQAEQAIKTWEVTQTDFLSPPELADTLTVFKRLTDVEYAEDEKWHLSPVCSPPPPARPVRWRGDGWRRRVHSERR